MVSGPDEGDQLEKQDGWTIHGGLVTPPDFEQGRRSPMIVQPHGGRLALKNRTPNRGCIARVRLPL